MGSDAIPRHCDPDKPPSEYLEYRDRFDMVDTEEELAYWDCLCEPLKVCKSEILEAYNRFDTEAMQNRNRHRMLSTAAAFLAAVAVLLAIFQLAYPEWIERLGIAGVPALETISAITALFAVGLGIYIAGKSRWLLARHKAERLRFLKFRYLIDPDVWCGDDRSKRRTAQLENDVRDVCKMATENFDEWTMEKGAREIPADAASRHIDQQTLDQLTSYYRAKRVVYQSKYFSDRVGRFHQLKQAGSWLGMILFFSSVAAVLVHFGFDLVGHSALAHELGRLFIFLAAAIPAVGAGIHSITAGSLPGHNWVRYRAKEAVLTHENEHIKTPTSADAKIRDMEFCEQTLAFEHREWARLMIETEVFP
jgi:hypothetical protein